MMRIMSEPRPLRVLLIDNDEATRELLARDLQSLGHEVTQAEDGAQGVEAAKQDPPPELVIIDLQMDLMGGEAVWEQIQSDPRTSAVPAIFCSLQRYQTLRRRVGERPRTTLYKPFRIQELQNAILQAMATVQQ